ncbi:MAG TPA: AAA family ATPase [Solirubrobacterales bacterium]
MQIAKIRKIRNFRSLREVGPLELGDITVFVGSNNSGKSSILQAVLLLQQGFAANGRQVRLGESEAEISLRMKGLQGFSGWGTNLRSDAGMIEIKLGLESNLSLTVETPTDETRLVDRIPDREPNHLLVPFLSQRRPETFNEDVREENANGVHPDMRFLAAKLTRVGQSAHPGHAAYAEACRQILGVVVTAIPSPNGQIPGVFVGSSENIALADMGAGVTQVVGLLADLALARNKIFVIEEPENDLHPAALRALLDLIVESARENQFLVSTHSNLVLRHLGSQPKTRIFHVEADKDAAWPPATAIREVAPEPAARSEVLISLGYELRDFEFFDGWLFLEESSAESIIRDYLIPWFVPDLGGRLRTVSARGVSRVAPIFEDFERLVLFTHLEQRYRNRAWVVVDGDEAGTAVIGELRDRYSSGWMADRFRALSESAFERYYPATFDERTDAVLGETDKRRRRELKLELLKDVLAWIEHAPDVAKAEFEHSAAEIIAILREIETVLNSAHTADSVTA